MKEKNSDIFEKIRENVKQEMVEEQIQFIEQSSMARSKKDLDNELIIEDYKNRIITVGDVDVDIMTEISNHIIKWNKEDSQMFEGIVQYVSTFCKEEDINLEEIAGMCFKPITLKISSYGGNVWEGFGLVDVIMNSRTPIVGIAMDKVMSMGAVIFSVCHVRYAMPNCTILYHDGTFGSYDSMHKVLDLSKHVEVLHKRIKKVIIEHTEITEELWCENERKEWFIFPEEGKNLGIVDAIIGLDISMDVLF